MSNPKSPDGPEDGAEPPELMGGPTLGPDGKLERTPAPHADSPDVREEEPPLELEERPPRPDTPITSAPSFGSPAPKRSGGMWLLLLLLGATLAAAWLLVRGVRFGANDGAPIVLIDSEPSGAGVRVDGRQMGDTPIVFQNRYPNRPIPLELRRRGYKPWRGTFPGGEEVKRTIKLEKR